jgi:hypothetical protein
MSHESNPTRFCTERHSDSLHGSFRPRGSNRIESTSAQQSGTAAARRLSNSQRMAVSAQHTPVSVSPHLQAHVFRATIRIRQSGLAGAGWAGTPLPAPHPNFRSGFATRGAANTARLTGWPRPPADASRILTRPSPGARRTRHLIDSAAKSADTESSLRQRTCRRSDPFAGPT